MFKWFKISAVATLVAMVALVAVGTGAAFAQGPTAGAGPVFGGSWGMGSGIGGSQNSLVAIAAQVLGMEQTALVAELNNGKTIAQVAQAKNIPTDQIVSAAIQSHRQTLQAAVTAGRLTQAQADEALATMKTQIEQELTNAFAPRGNGTGLGVPGTNYPMSGQFAGRGRWNR
jgi:hypothetical protein